MSDQATIAVRVKHHFTASPERVFDAWLDPVKAREGPEAPEEAR